MIKTCWVCKCTSQQYRAPGWRKEHGQYACPTCAKGGDGPHIGDPIEIRGERGKDSWFPARISALSPTRVWYTITTMDAECGPCRLDCEGRTWRILHCR